MRLTMMLADSAQAVGGKLYILGGGWSVGGPGPTPMAIAVKIAVPWTEANRHHKLKLQLLTEDGQIVTAPAPTGEQTIEMGGEFEVGRPAGIPEGTDLDVVFALNIPPLSLQPGGGYVWRCWIDGKSQDDWKLTFNMRTADSQPSP